MTDDDDAPEYSELQRRAILAGENADRTYGELHKAYADVGSGDSE